VKSVVNEKSLKGFGSDYIIALGVVSTRPLQDWRLPARRQVNNTVGEGALRPDAGKLANRRLRLSKKGGGDVC